MTIDLEGVLIEVRERVRQRRASGAYGPDVDAALHAPLPGGPAVLVDDLADPLSSLAGTLGQPVEYDPRSRRRYVGPVITFARKVLMGLLRWWIVAVNERQERINRLVAAALQEQAARPAPQLDARLSRLERDWQERKQDEVAANLHSAFFAARFSGDERVIRAQSEGFLDLFRGRTRVLDVGSGRGTFLELAREKGIGAYGVDMDRRMVDEVLSRGLEAEEADVLTHLRGLPAGTLDGLYARHVAEHILPGQLIAMLRECRRVLVFGAPLVLITPNVATLTVGAHTFWLDPSHIRPIPPELLRFYLEVEGFSDVQLRTLEPSELRLSDEVPEGPQLENVRLLNDVLFGDRDYAVTARNA